MPEPAATDGAPTASVLCTTDTAPGTTVIVGCVVVTGTPPSVAPIARAVPASVPSKLAVYVPSVLSVTAPIVPSLVPPVPFVNSTNAPPVASAFPAASRAASVSIAVLPDASVAAETVTSDCATEAAPGMTWTVGVADVTGTPLIVAPIARGVPAVVPTYVAECVPSRLLVVVSGPKSLVPTPFVNTTTSVGTARTLPCASRTVSVTVPCEPDAMPVADTESVDSAGEAGPAVTVIVGKALVTAAPSTIAPIVRALPVVVAVKFAVNVPFKLLVAAPIVPSLVPEPFVNTTAGAAAGTTFPWASRAVNVSAVSDPEASVGAPTASELCPSEIGPGTTVICGRAPTGIWTLSTLTESVAAVPAVSAPNVVE